MTAAQLSGPLAELLADMIPRLAAKAHKWYPGVPAEDFEQECWLRALSKPDKLKRYQSEGSEAYIWQELKRAAVRLGKEDERYRRAQKAASEGYATHDEAFYSTRLLAALLPSLIESEGNVPEAVAHAVARQRYAAGVFISQPFDSEAAEDYMTMLMDISQALDRIKPGERRMLWTYYGVTQEDTDEGRWERHKLASSMGITYEALRQRASRALRSLQDQLGGEDPWLRRGNER